MCFLPGYALVCLSLICMCYVMCCFTHWLNITTYVGCWFLYVYMSVVGLMYVLYVVVCVMWSVVFHIGLMSQPMLVVGFCTWTCLWLACCMCYVVCCFPHWFNITAYVGCWFLYVDMSVVGLLYVLCVVVCVMWSVVLHIGLISQPMMVVGFCTWTCLWLACCMCYVVCCFPHWLISQPMLVVGFCTWTCLWLACCMCYVVCCFPHWFISQPILVVGFCTWTCLWLACYMCYVVCCFPHWFNITAYVGCWFLYVDMSVVGLLYVLCGLLFSTLI